MSIKSRRQLENTKAKLKLIEERLAALKEEPVTNAVVHELTRESLSSFANQLREEIIRFEAHLPAPSK